MSSRHYQQDDEHWLRTLLAFINPLRGPGIIVAILATFVEVAGEALPWYAVLSICATNLLAIRLVSLIIMDTVCFFLDTFLILWGRYQQSKRNGKHSETWTRRGYVSRTHSTMRRGI